MSYLLNTIDIFGRPVKLYYDGDRSTITSAVGGVLTIMLVLAGLLYFGIEYERMIMKR